MSLKDRKIIVTGGPTREWIDPVRYISNASSGKMGAALADEAHARCREAVFIHGPVESAIRTGRACRCVGVETTADLLKAVLDELEDRCVLIMAAAPADYAPAERAREKIKKTGNELVLVLRKNPDILKNVAAVRKRGDASGSFIVGFAAETTNVEEYARGKLEDKNLDMICLNDVSAEGAGFATDTNIITIFSKDGSRIALPKMSKAEAARRILDQVEKSID